MAKGSDGVWERRSGCGMLEVEASRVVAGVGLVASVGFGKRKRRARSALREVGVRDRYRDYECGRMGVGTGATGRIRACGFFAWENREREMLRKACDGEEEPQALFPSHFNKRGRRSYRGLRGIYGKQLSAEQVCRIFGRIRGFGGYEELTKIRLEPGILCFKLRACDLRRLLNRKAASFRASMQLPLLICRFALATGMQPIGWIEKRTNFLAPCLWSFCITKLFRCIKYVSHQV